MLCDPEANNVVAKEAVVPLMVPIPSVVDPSRKLTDPVAPFDTVAVNVTEAPKFAGFRDELREMVGVALFTTCDKAEDVAVLKFESPPYTAVMDRVPTIMADVAYVAVVPEIVAAEPRFTPLSLNWHCARRSG